MKIPVIMISVFVALAVVSFALGYGACWVERFHKAGGWKALSGIFRA